jgi:hypothetical protein
VSDSNPLVERVDALLKRHQQQQAATGQRATEPTPALAQPVAKPPAVEADDDVPVLTEIVDPRSGSAEGTQAHGLAEGAEAAVLERLLAEIERSLETSLNRSVGEVVEQAMDGLRAELSIRVRQSVRDALAAALARELAEEPTRPTQ